MLRKNIDLDNKTIAILQIEATLSGYGSLKPYLEKILVDRASRLAKERPKIYSSIVDQKVKKASRGKAK